MPSFRKIGGSGWGTLGTIQTTYSVLREISFDEVREEALRVPRMVFIGPNGELAYSTLWMLTGIERTDTVKVVENESDAGDLTRYDVVLVYDPQKIGTADTVRARLERSDSSSQVFEILNGAAPAGNAAEVLRQAITDSIPERAPAIGRAYPAFRQAAVKTIVDETSRANAQFALIANVPSIVPVVGSLLSVGADVMVLTKNQVMMVYKIAAIHGKDLNNQVAILRELLPVIGAGLFWRTAAREATSFLPFAAGSIPKVVIAFSGTVAAGWAADFYYRKGRKPSYEQVRQYIRQASDAALHLPAVARGRNGSDDAVG
jgi:uncharacterized protein (DUF697 family)